MNETNFMAEAVKEAEAGIAAGRGGPFGSVIVKGGKIIGRGHNRVIETNDPTAHGEITAIRDACIKTGGFDLTGAELYTTCYPCPMCLGAILWARIQKVYYCADSPAAAAIGFDDSAFYEKLNNTEFIKGMFVYDSENAGLCAGLFEKYAGMKDRKKY